MVDAIGRAHGAALDTLSVALWSAHAAGEMTDDEASSLATAIDARRKLARGRGAQLALPVRKPVQRPPERSVAIERRRRLAASGPMPPALAARFTTGELAVLRIVADENAARGKCAVCLDAIAARAGVSRSTAKNAIRQASRLGLVEVVERRRPGAKNLPNVVTIVDREWLAWMARGNRTGVRNPTTTDTRGFREGGNGDRGANYGTAAPYKTGFGLRRRRSACGSKSRA